MPALAEKFHEGMKVVSETDQTEDSNPISIQILIMQGDDEHLEAYKNAAGLQHRLLSNLIFNNY